MTNILKGDILGIFKYSIQHCFLCRLADSTVSEEMLGPNPVPEIIDPVFTKTSQYARFLLSENERFGLVFVKTGSINSDCLGLQ
jgi:hypothetical protein